MSSPKIIAEKITNFKFAPRHAKDPAGSYRITFLSTIDNLQSVKEMYLPPYTYENFIKRKLVHYIQVPSDPPMTFRIAMGGKLLRKEDLPPLTRYGLFRLRLYWLYQIFIGNI